MAAHRKANECRDLVAAVLQHTPGFQATDKHTFFIAKNIVQMQLIVRRWPALPTGIKRRSHELTGVGGDMQSPGKPVLVEVETEDGIISGGCQIQAPLMANNLVTVLEER